MVQKASRDVVDLKTRPITQGLDVDGDGSADFTIDGTRIGLNLPASAEFTDITMSGVLDMAGNRIANVAAPAFGNDAVPRDWAQTQDSAVLASANAYTDSQVGSIPPPPQQVPTGAIMAWPSPVPPPGWLLCDGSPIGPYPALAALLGPFFGPNLPDLRGRVIAMEDLGAGVLPTLPGPVGAVGGSEQQAPHTHTYSGSTSIARSSSRCDGGGGDNEWEDHAHTYSGTTSPNSSGLGKVQPTMILNWIIKT